MSDEQTIEVLLDASAFEPRLDAEFPYTVLNTNDEPVGEIYLKAVSMPTMDRYRDILVGMGRRNGKPREAREYLFRKAFVRFEPKQKGAKLALNGHRTEADFFIAETPKTVDRVIQEYHNSNFVDVQEKKE